MDNNLSKVLKKNIIKSFAIGFVLVVGAIVLAFFTVRLIIKRQSLVETTATISDIVVSGYDSNGNNEYTTIVTYEVEGKSYTVKLSEYHATDNVGDSIQILYDPAHPDKVENKKITKVLILAGVGLGLAFGAFVVLKGGINDIKRLNESRNERQNYNNEY